MLTVIKSSENSADRNARKDIILEATREIIEYRRSALIELRKEYGDIYVKSKK